MTVYPSCGVGPGAGSFSNTSVSSTSQAGPLGVRRPRQRHLPGPIRLDSGRPPPAGQRSGFAGPDPGPILGRPVAQEDLAAAGQARAVASESPARPMAGLRGLPTPRRSRACRPHQSGNSGSPAPARRSTANGSPRRRPATTGASPATVCYTPAAWRGIAPTRQRHDNSAPPASPRGLLEPCAGPTRTHGSPDRVGWSHGSHVASWTETGITLAAEPHVGYRRSPFAGGWLMRRTLAGLPEGSPMQCR